jgi:hypothetical protein
MEDSTIQQLNNVPYRLLIIGKVIIITAYQPDPDLWIDFERRRG